MYSYYILNPLQNTKSILSHLTLNLGKTDFLSHDQP